MHNTSQNIVRSLDFLQDVINRRLSIFFNKEEQIPFEYPPMPELVYDAFLVDFLSQKKLVVDEYLVLLLALAPHIQPDFIDSIIHHYLPHGGDFTEIGGVKGTNHRGMLPTGETALFIIAGNDVLRRMTLQKILFDEGVLVRENIITLEQVKEGEPMMSGRLILSNAWLLKLLTGKEPQVKFGLDFPAKKVNTEMTWDDLVLNAYTLSQLDDIKIWLAHHNALLADKVLKRKIKPGYKVLFFGPSGTGKTLTATLLGKQFEKEVYRIDLSQVVSKYIGETEKNLEKVFTKAENKHWILFFDEADALFGKRTSVQNAHDRYANQEVSYLLQRIEDYPGLLILASNFKSNIDNAFLRRFHTIIHFPVPNAGERLKLWQNTLPESLQTEPALNVNELAEKYELNGAAILNIVHYASLRSISRNDEFIRQTDLLEAIRKEYRKEEKSMIM